MSPPSDAGAGRPMRSRRDDRAWQRERWERIGLGVRLAYNPDKVEVMRYWLALGERLVAEGVLEPLPMWRRSLRLLLQVAGDEGLPLGWRRVALDHAARPAVRLAALLARSDPAQAAAVRAAWQAAHDAAATDDARRSR